MTPLAARVTRALLAANVPIVGLSVGDVLDKSTWKVQPSTLQAAAQPIIDAFDPNDPALDVADLDAEVKAALDQDRLISAVVWTILDTYSAPATIAKYNAARTKVIAAFKLQPWKP